MDCCDLRGDLRGDTRRDVDAAAGWRASLRLGYERRGNRTVLATRAHEGPLVVQKPLYPEGDGVCHTIVVHPPAGIAGGDTLELAVQADAGAAAQLTTPGAGKWYRTRGPWARQSIAIRADDDACVEWLPQETIVFDGARADMRLDVHLADAATYLGWDILCFGRSGSGERFERGACRMLTTVTRAGKPLWHERGHLDGGGALLQSPAGLDGQPVCGTLVASGPQMPQGLLAACREPRPRTGRAAVTSVPGLLVARYLGPSSEAAKAYFAALWEIVRPALMGRAAHMPRIWRT